MSDTPADATEALYQALNPDTGIYEEFSRRTAQRFLAGPLSDPVVLASLPAVAELVEWARWCSGLYEMTVDQDDDWFDHGPERWRTVLENQT